MPAVTPRCLRRFSAAALLTASVPFALSACGAQEESSSSPEPVFSSQAPAEDESSSGENADSAAAPSPSESTDGSNEATTQPQDKGEDSVCTELPNDPRKVYASGTAPGLSLIHI